MRELFLVAVGGGLGASGRLFIGKLFLHTFPGASLPLGTLAVNLVGCFFIGVAAGYLASLTPNRLDLELLLITGFLGGFTTFSAFGFELFSMLRKHEYLSILAYSSLSMFGGLLLVLLGWHLVRQG